MLWALQAAVDIVKSSDGVRTKYMDQLNTSLKNWEELCREKKYTPLPQNQVTLPLPSRLHVALDTPHFEVVGSMFRFLLAVVSEVCSGEELVEKIESGVKEMIQLIEKRMKDEKNTHLVYRRETMEYIVNIVEVSYFGVVYRVCKKIVLDFVNVVFNLFVVQ